MKPPRAPELRLYIEDDEIIVDNFAGGGGASSGIGGALGRDPFVAINHDPEAIAMHKANHPGTRHYVEDVFDVDPVEACRGRRVGLAWFSPTCTHFSKAKGGQLRDTKIRGLAWVAVKWAELVAPRVICLENVEEFADWGPLDDDGVVIRERRGETFREFVAKLEALDYVVEHRLLRACDFGAPTTRRRLFLVARRDGRPIRWPEPTHGAGRAEPYRTAAECIDWSIPCPSIFDRARPLADKTMARIARGIRKFVIEAARAGRPFIVPTAHGGVGRSDHRVHSADEPLRTITGQRRGDHAIAVPYMVHRSNGERVGQAPRIYDVNRPIGTIVAGGQKHAACVAWLVKHYGDRATGGFAGASSLESPAGTITSQDHHSLATVHLAKFYGTSTGSSLEEPAPTVTAGGGKLAQVCAFLTRYNGQSIGQPAENPIGTIDTTDRYGVVTVAIDGVVTVAIDGEEYAIVDIGMRMLTPRELYNCQGFRADYKIDVPGPSGKPLTKTAQIRMVGNSVAPPAAAAVVRAQFEVAW